MLNTALKTFSLTTHSVIKFVFWTLSMVAVSLEVGKSFAEHAELCRDGEFLRRRQKIGNNICS
jgi:hypothetical protein